MEKLQFGSIITADLKEDTITFEMEESFSLIAGDFAIIKIESINDRIAVEEFIENLKNK